jgi:predicted transcriptional regulator
MLTRTCLLALACVLLATSVADSTDEKSAPEDLSESRVRYRLNAIETAQLLNYYEVLVKRELDFRENMRASLQASGNRVAEFQQALQDLQADLAAIKRKLVALEVERTERTARLGKGGPADATPDSLERVNRTLDKVLERLNTIEKRLEKLERSQ